MKRNKKIQIFLLLSFIMIFSPTYVQAMHIMEGFLSPKWAIFWFVVTAPFFIMGLKNLNKIFRDNPNKKMLVALCGAFVFVLSALKMPSVTGSCSHPTGVGLGAVLFGPTVMTVLGVIVLLFQALLLAHGGLTTLGANTFSMAVAGPILAYGVFKGLKKLNIKSSHAIFWAAALGDLFTYIVTAIQLGFAHPDPVGGIMVSIIKFMGIFAITQIPLAIAEGLLTSVVYNLLLDYKKEGIISDENIN